jgi:hypothetical protein
MTHDLPSTLTGPQAAGLDRFTPAPRRQVVRDFTPQNRQLRHLTQLRAQRAFGAVCTSENSAQAVDLRHETHLSCAQNARTLAENTLNLTLLRQAAA